MLSFRAARRGRLRSPRRSLARVRWKLTAALLAAIWLATADVRAASGSLPPPLEAYTLPNGLRVILAPDPAAPLVSIEVRYGAGSGDDPDGLAGLAHMAEHMTFVRTAHAAHLLQELTSLGACPLNGETWTDFTRYYETVPPERLEAALWLESERMGFAVDAVTEANLDAERLVVLNELHDNGSMGLDVALTGSLFPRWHPYFHEGSGERELGRIHAADIQAFLRTWYVPGNASLVLAGRFDGAKATSWISRYFAPVPAVPPPVRPVLPPWTPIAKTITISEHGPRGTWVGLEWLTARRGTADDMTLDFVADALAGPGNRLLSPALVDTHLATDVGARQHSMREGSRFVISIKLAQEASPDRVVAVVRAALLALAAGKVTGEAGRVGALLAEVQALELETTWGRASRLASVRPGVELPTWIDDRRAHVTDADVARTVSTWLPAERGVTVALFAHPKTPGTVIRVDGVQQNEP
jgi:zinc protease